MTVSGSVGPRQMRVGEPPGFGWFGKERLLFPWRDRLVTCPRIGGFRNGRPPPDVRPGHPRRASPAPEAPKPHLVRTTLRDNLGKSAASSDAGPLTAGRTEIMLPGEHAQRLSAGGHRLVAICLRTSHRWVAASNHRNWSRNSILPIGQNRCHPSRQQWNCSMAGATHGNPQATRWV